MRWFNGRHRVLAGLAIASVMLSGCALFGQPQEVGREEQDAPALPTVPEVEDVGDEALGGAAETFEQTWANYLRDAIAEQVKDRQQKLSLLQRYEDPDITEQNMAGLVQDINLKEDRTTFNVNGPTASGYADFDIQLTYANDDSETRNCKPFVTLTLHEEDNRWYVQNPGALQIFAVCAP